MPPADYLTPADAHKLDELATDRFGIPSVVLMENAAANAAAILRDRYPVARHAVIYCGPGNNGGDGYALARHLHNAGLKAELVSAKDPSTDDAKTNHAVARAMGLPILSPGDPVEPRGDTLLIDALLGIGAEPPLRPPMDELAANINTLRPRALATVALDVPTGLPSESFAEKRAEGDTPAVRADLTIAFAAPKPVHLDAAAQAFIGDLSIAEIGAPRELVESLLSRAPEQTHPGDDATGPAQRRPQQIPGRAIDAPPRR